MPDPQDPVIALYHDLVRIRHTRQTVGAALTTVAPGERYEVAGDLIDLWRHLKPKAPPPPPPPPPLLDRIELDTGYITFSGGVPVGGYSHLSLFPDGAFSFTGHFHDSGFPSFDDALVWVVRSSAGSVFTWSHTGHLHGTFESGSRDDDWGNSGTHPAIAAGWADLSAGYSWSWRASVNVDLGALLDAAIKGIGAVGSIIAIV